MTCNPSQLEAMRAQRAEGMAAARAWRDTVHPVMVDQGCYKCGGFGIIFTWGGRRGEGGRVGPCPICQREGARRLVAALARETFGDPEEKRQKRFNQIFTRGEEHGRQ